MTKRVSIEYIFFIICIYILIFQNFLQTIFWPIQYFDEFVSLLAIPILLFSLIKNKGSVKLKSNNFFMFLLFVLLIMSGLYSSAKYKYQPLGIALSDMLLISKFFLAYLMSQLLFTNRMIQNYKKRISTHVKVIVIMIFLLTILNYIFALWPSDSYRFGIMTNKLFFSHPTVLVSLCIFLLSLLVLTKNDNKKIITYIIFLLVVMLSTLRFKAIGAGFLVLILLFYLQHKNKKISITKLSIIAILAIMFAWNQISYYYIDLDGSARKVLTETSISIAKDYFPLGTGFATFGSYFSSINYSPVYLMYGIWNVYGLSYGNSWFISDTFWPMIMGQFGVMGLLLYILLIITIFMKIQKEYSIEQKNLYIAKLVCFGYLLISSTSEAAFVSSLAIPLAIIIGINIGKVNKGE